MEPAATIAASLGGQRTPLIVSSGRQEDPGRANAFIRQYLTLIRRTPMEIRGGRFYRATWRGGSTGRVAGVPTSKQGRCLVSMWPRMIRKACVLSVVVTLSACSSLQEGGGATTWGGATAAAPALPASSVVTSPRLVWVPEWGIYLREGQDVVFHRGTYYRYEAGRWHSSESAQGPWTPIGPPREALTEPRSDERSADPGRLAGQRSSARRSPIPPAAHESVGRLAKRTNIRNERPDIVPIALRYRGVPYRWGGSTPAGFDCSGFVLYVFAKAAITLPHNVAQQYRHGVPVTREELEPGDLVFFDGLRHNGIYIGEGRFIHAARSGKSVIISRLNDSWYESRWAGGRRLSSVASTALRE